MWQLLVGGWLGALFSLKTKLVWFQFNANRFKKKKMM